MEAGNGGNPLGWHTVRRRRRSEDAAGRGQILAQVARHSREAAAPAREETVSISCEKFSRQAHARPSEGHESFTVTAVYLKSTKRVRVAATVRRS
jgi:hypothetical protein